MHKNNFLKVLLICICSILVFQTFAQEGDYTYDLLYRSSSSATPNTASFQRYADLPVSPYTGVASIKVPIYTIGGKYLRVPVYMSYHSSGVKVDQVSSWTGTDWTLQAGGMISRQQRSGDDLEIPFNDYLVPVDFTEDCTVDLEFTPDKTGQDGIDYVEQLVGFETNTSVNVEPDVFYYNFNGISGRFFIIKDGSTNEVQVITNDRKTIKIEYPTTSTDE